MKSFATSAICALSLFGSALSSPIKEQFRRDVDTEFNKRAGTFAITGVQDGSGVQPRISLRNMANNADQFNLYLLALTNWKWMDQSQMTSYYGIAGIHGVPNVPWDGVQGDGSGAVGYCTHSSPIFPGWHRTYLALFEQIFLSVVQATIQSFPANQQPRWQAAAKNMRIPYWDWAQGPGKAPSVVPTTLTDKYVTITTPQGAQSIINPLFRFDFHPLDSAGMLYAPWNEWVVTLRYPTSSSDPKASSQESQVTSSIQNAAQSLHDQVYNMFTQCGDYTEFSNDAAAFTTPNCHNSLEGIHDSMHSLLGGPNDGHMTYLWYAAFDPVFWIHHAQVDRLFAMWQVLYPNNYIVPSPTHADTYTMPSGTTVDGNTQLAPFHRDTSGTFWTSNAVRDHTIFGYTYPEIQQANGNTQTMQGIVNYLYGSSGSSGSSKRKTRRDIVSDAENAMEQIVDDLPGDLGKLLTPTGRKSDWTANIVTQRFGLNSSYNVYIFMGDYDQSNPAGWGTESNMVGVFGVFAQKGMAMNMSNPLLVSSSIPLTTTLVGKVADGCLSNLDDGTVTDYLKQNLRWAVVTSDLKAVDNADVPGLQVSVVGAPVTPANSDTEFPTWGAWNTFNNVTHGLAGGLQNAMDWDSFKQQPGEGEDDCEEE